MGTSGAGVAVPGGSPAWLALGAGTGAGQAGEAGQEGLLVSMVSLPMGAWVGGMEDRGAGRGEVGGREWGRRACADTRTYDQTR